MNFSEDFAHELQREVHVDFTIEDLIKACENADQSRIFKRVTPKPQNPISVKYSLYKRDLLLIYHFNQMRNTRKTGSYTVN